jgi:hypothetical protein
MERDDFGQPDPHSPFDPYIATALEFVTANGDTALSMLGDACVREFQWLPGFADVIIGSLKTNGLIVVNEWEPGKLHVSERGKRWLFANRESLSIS